MQIHELNNFTGTLGSGSYLAIDDGNDTGKISKAQLFAATEARIDNIIAGPAPSAEEIVDARLGDDGVTYPSLGDAIRDQFSDVKSAINDLGDEVLNGYSPIREKGAFEHGYMAFSNPPHIEYSEITATNSAPMMFDTQTTLIVDPEYQTMRFYFNETTGKYEWTEGWSAGNKVVSANRRFGISIRKGTGSDSTPIPLDTLTSAVTFVNDFSKFNKAVEDVAEIKPNYSFSESNDLDYDFAIMDTNGKAIVSFQNGNIKTKKFDSSELAFGVEYHGDGMPFGKRRYTVEHYMDMNYDPEIYIESGDSFGDYYFQFSEFAQTVGVINMVSKEVVYTWHNPTYDCHCNSVSFGNEYYDANDEFPLIYASDENNGSMFVYRITRSGNVFNLTKVQRILFENASVTGLYTPNGIVDVDNSHIAIVGFDNSNPDSNTKLYVKTHRLPKLSEGEEVILQDADCIDAFKVRLVSSATQGATIYGGRIYQCYGFYDEKYVVAIDLKMKAIVTIIDCSADIMPTIASEPEGVFVWENDLYIVAQNLKIYRFDFTRR